MAALRACDSALEVCAMPLMIEYFGLSEEETLQQIANTDLRETCRYLFIEFIDEHKTNRNKALMMAVVRNKMRKYWPNDPHEKKRTISFKSVENLYSSR